MEEQKKAKIEVYLDEEGKVVTIIQGKGMDLLGMLMAAIDNSGLFRTLVLKSAEFLQTMKQKDLQDGNEDE